ncbi:MAG: DUF3322 domain-containing protein [Mariprofundaceae bacterium]|nr:DUF3322 domain-containing protein [Mariprofundaceae bacterium]
MSDWGLLPDAVIARITQREWSNSVNLRGRLSGTRPFPIRISLKAPTAAQASQDIEHFRHFVLSWKNFSYPYLLQWQQKKYHRLGEQQVPVALQLASMSQLIELLGPKAEARKQHWDKLMRPVLNIDTCLSQVLLKHLAVVEEMTPDDTALLAQLIPQLEQGQGQGNYLRALPVQGVDTKFVESYQTLVADLLDSLHDGAVKEQGGLLEWLDCCEIPSGWLQVRPLCSHSQKQLAGLPLLQIDTRTLQQYPLPAVRILVVENKQSGYALPELDDTIAIFGGGRNTSWMQGQWLAHKSIAYWGDMDSWGLAMLSEARSWQPHVRALMMDEVTLLQHKIRMINEKESYKPLPEHLNEAEQQLFLRLREGHYGKTRLEQERLTSDYVSQQLRQWHQATSKSNGIDPASF